MPRALKLWSVLASICLVATILLAKAFPASWIAVWPGALSVQPSLAFLYLASLRMIASVEKLILARSRMLARSRRHSEGGLGASPSLNERLNGLSREVDELKRIAEELDWKVKGIPRHAVHRAKNLRVNYGR